MALIVWSPDLEVGVKIIDEQHYALVGMINRLSEAMSSGKGKLVLGAILGELIDYTGKHFATEERLMREHAYAHSPSHQAEHRELVRRVTEFKQKFDDGGGSLAISVLNFLCDWLKKHIQESDKKFGKHLLDCGVR
ncbi:MAG TPA: bacteriohemerythrin [Polyangiaceae bacterium]